MENNLRNSNLQEGLGRVTQFPRIFLFFVWNSLALLSTRSVRMETGIRWKPLGMDLVFPTCFFTDDLLLFAEANQEICEAILNVLEEFCSLSS